MSNTKQIGLGVLQYTQDYDERLPPSYIAATGLRWPVILQPYLKSEQIFFCPSDSVHDSGVAFGQGANVSYGWNFVYLTHGGVKGSAYNNGGIALSIIAASAETVMLGDGPTGSGDDWALSSPADYTNYQPPARHLEGANIAFVDGHSKWFKVPGKLDTIALWDLT